MQIGFLKPDGQFIECGEFKHLEIAAKLLREETGEVTCGLVDAEKALFDMGWIQVYRYGVMGHIGRKAKKTGRVVHLTKEQIDWLHDNYDSFPEEKQRRVDFMIDELNRNRSFGHALSFNW